MAAWLGSIQNSSNRSCRARGRQEGADGNHQAETISMAIRLVIGKPTTVLLVDSGYRNPHATYVESFRNPLIKRVLGLQPASCTNAWAPRLGIGSWHRFRLGRNGWKSRLRCRGTSHAASERSAAYYTQNPPAGRLHTKSIHIHIFLCVCIHIYILTYQQGTAMRTHKRFCAYYVGVVVVGCYLDSFLLTCDMHGQQGPFQMLGSACRVWKEPNKDLIGSQCASLVEAPTLSRSGHIYLCHKLQGKGRYLEGNPQLSITAFDLAYLESQTGWWGFRAAWFKFTAPI